MVYGSIIALPLLSFFLILLLAAYGTTEEQTSKETEGDEVSLHPLLVDLELPETAKAGEEVTIRSIVTMNDEIVEDADQMEYKIKNDAGESEIIEAQFDGEEAYTIQKKFEEPGTYTVTAHTTPVVSTPCRQKKLQSNNRTQKPRTGTFLKVSVVRGSVKLNYRKVF